MSDHTTSKVNKWNMRSVKQEDLKSDYKKLLSLCNNLSMLRLEMQNAQYNLSEQLANRILNDAANNFDVVYIITEVTKSTGCSHQRNTTQLTVSH